MPQNSDFYIFMPLTMSLFNYPKLKHTKLVAVLALNSLMETAELSWSPVNKHLAKLYYPIIKFPFSSAFFSMLQELTLLLLLYRWRWNTYIFFSIYPASAHYSIHLLIKNLFIFCLLTTPRIQKIMNNMWCIKNHNIFIVHNDILFSSSCVPGFVFFLGTVKARNFL